MNLPNKLTTLRLFIVVIIAILYSIWGQYVWCQFVNFGLFLIGSFTDFLDGHIARKYNLVTDYGKLMDPVADKLLVIGAVLILADMKFIPFWWLSLIIIARELFVLGIRLVAVSNDNNVIAADIFGKAKTVTQMVSISMLMLLGGLICLNNNISFMNSDVLFVLLIIAQVLFYISVLLCVLSGINYFLKNKKYFRQK